MSASGSEVVSLTCFQIKSRTSSGKNSLDSAYRARTASTRSVTIPHHIFTLAESPTPTSWPAAAGRRLPSCNPYTVTRSLIRCPRWSRKPSQHSKIHSKINTHSKQKSPAKRQIQRLRGALLCRQRGSNPHGIVCWNTFRSTRAKFHAKSFGTLLY